MNYYNPGDLVTNFYNTKTGIVLSVENRNYYIYWFIKCLVTKHSGPMLINIHITKIS